MPNSPSRPSTPARLAMCLAAVSLAASQATAQLIHLWDFNAGAEMADSVGGLNLIAAPGEGSVLIDGFEVSGTAADLVFESGYNGVGQAYRPFYVDASQSSTAGAGLTGSDFVTPSQFTLEAILKVDTKTTGSAVNYIFQTRPGSDRGYFLVQDEDNLSPGSVAGVGSIIGNNFGDVGIGAEITDDETWLYVAAVIDLSIGGTASMDFFAADLSAGETSATLRLNKTYNTANPSALVGVSGIFGIGNFAIDRNGDNIPEASQEWFQGAIDYIAIYDGLLDPDDLDENLTARLRAEPDPIVPEPSGIGFTATLACLVLLARRRSPRQRH